MKRILFWVSIAVSVLMLGLALRGLKLDKFVEDLGRANLAWLLPGITAYFVAVWVRAWRWSYMLRPIQVLSPNALYPITVIGYMGNNIYPARIGEFVRAYVLRRKSGIAVASTLTTVILERILDALVMAAFVLIGLPNVPALPDSLRNGVQIVSAVFVAAAVAFFVLALRPAMANQLAGSLINGIIPSRFRAVLHGLVDKVLAGMAGMRSGRDVLILLSSSVLVWLIETLKYFCIGIGFGLNLGFVDYMLVNGVSNLFTIIPSPPGAIGTFDAGSILALTSLGVDQALASAYTIVLHVALWLPVTALGAFLMLREGLRWNDLKQAESAA